VLAAIAAACGTPPVSPPAARPTPPAAPPPAFSLRVAYVPAFHLSIALGDSPWRGAVQLEYGEGHDSANGVDIVTRPKSILHVDLTATDGDVRITPVEVRRLAGNAPYTVWLEGKAHSELGASLGPALACARAIEPLYARDACRDSLPNEAPPEGCDDDGKRAWSVLFDRAKQSLDACWPENDASVLERLRADPKVDARVKGRICERFLAALGDPPYARAPEPVLAACAGSSAALSKESERKARQAMGVLDLQAALDAARAKKPQGATPATERLGVGEDVACVLRSGRVVCWKDGVFKTLPVTDAIDMAISGALPCVLHAAGVVSCWEEFDAPTPQVVARLGDDAVALSHGASRCVLRGDGQARCRRGDDLHAIAGLRDATTIVSGMQSDCAIRKSGGVACWGSMPPHRVYDSKADEYAATAVPGLASIVAIAVGGWHLCALDRKGGVFCVGENSAGMLGDGTTNDSRTPVRVPGVSGATSIDASYIHTCAGKRGGKTMCWGAPRFSAAVDGPRESSVPGEVPGADDLTAVAVGTSRACGVRPSGEIVCWGMPDAAGNWPRAKGVELPPSPKP
jgi:hypothetical protein